MKSRGLVWDIENSAYTIDAWGTYQTDAIHIREYPQVLTVAWHWIGDNTRSGKPRIHVRGQDDFKSYNKGSLNDYELVKFTHELLSQADFEVAHNGDGHDVKIMTARMMLHGFVPPEPYRQVDTLKIYRRLGQFGGNSLKNLSKRFGTEQKGSPGSYEDTWLGCEAGDKKAWKRMKDYNKKDIAPLLELYLISRPWDKQSVPMNILEQRPDACPKCGKESLIAGMKYATTKTGRYQYFRCKACGATVKARYKEYEQAQEKAKYV